MVKLRGWVKGSLGEGDEYAKGEGNPKASTQVLTCDENALVL